MATRLRLGDRLIGEGLVTEKQRDVALEFQNAIKRNPDLKHLSIGEILTQLGFITDERLADVVAKLQDSVYVPILDSDVVDRELLASIPEPFARENLIIPWNRYKDRLQVFMADTSDENAVDQLRQLTGLFDIDCFQAVTSQLRKLIDRSFRYQDKPRDDLDRLGKQAESGDATELVDLLLYIAMKLEATDLHIRPSYLGSVVSFRIDGILHPYHIFSLSAHETLRNNIKVKGGGDIDEKGGEDIRFEHKVADRTLSCRVSSIPVKYGGNTQTEQIVLRIQDSQRLNLQLDELGIAQDNLKEFRRFLSFEDGIILLVGSTGSGKTTTLYAALREIDALSRNVVSIEDPIECDLPLVGQVEVNEKFGISYASTMKKFLRHDPDVILLGELRDSATSTLAVEAASTGHLVLSTLHANDSSTAFLRLIHHGIDPNYIVSVVRGVMSQRLFRKICSFCKEENKETSPHHEQFVDAVRQEFGSNQEVHFFKGMGCEQCNHTGHRGRTAVTEILKMSDGVAELITQRSDNRRIKQLAIEEGMRPLRRDAMLKVIKGIIDLPQLIERGIWIPP